MDADMDECSASRISISEYSDDDKRTLIINSKNLRYIEN